MTDILERLCSDLHAEMEERLNGLATSRGGSITCARPLIGHFPRMEMKSLVLRLQQQPSPSG